MAGHEWSVSLTPGAVRELAATPVDGRRRIARAIDGLAADPRPRGAERLAGRPGERIWRIRVGDYRVLYEIRDANVLVVVIRIGNRREVYRRR